MSDTQEILLSIYKKPTIKASEAGELFGMSRKTVNSSISLGDFFLPTFKVGRYRFVKLADLANYIDQQAQKGEIEQRALRSMLSKK